MLISGHYVPQQRVNREAFLGVLEWGKAKGRAREVRKRGQGHYKGRIPNAPAWSLNEGTAVAQ
jgi:hypothetical protein